MEDKKIFGLTPEELDRLSGNREPAVDPQYKMKPINPGETLEPCIRGAQKILDDPEKKAMMERIYRGQPKKGEKS